MPPSALTGGACWVAGRKLHKAGQPAATRPEDLCGIVGAGGGGGQPVGTASRSRREAQPLGILTSTAVVLGEKVLTDLTRVVSHVGVEGADLGRRHAARLRGAVPWRGTLRRDRC